MTFAELETDNFILKPASLMETSKTDDYRRFGAMCLADDQALLVSLMDQKVFDDEDTVEDAQETLIAQNYAIAGLLGGITEEFYFIQSKETGDFVGKLSLYKDRNDNFQFRAFVLPSSQESGVMSEVYPVVAKHTRDNGFKVDYMEAREDGPHAQAALKILLKDGFEIVSTEPFRDNPDAPKMYDDSGRFHRLERRSGPGVL